MKEEEIITEMSNAYFTYIFKDVTPFFNNLNISKFDLTSVDSETLERVFFLMCLCSSDLKIPNQNYSLDIFKKKTWLGTNRPCGVESKQGVITQTLLLGNCPIVMKKAKSNTFHNITLRDFAVGINVNKIISSAPFFVRTLGCFEYKSQFHIGLDYVPGITMKKFLHDETSTFKDFLNIFFQILLGLEIAQNKLNFTHYDLHADNVILTPLEHKFNVQLYGNEYRIHSKYKPVMIDFGLSSISVQGKTLGQNRLASKCIYPRVSVGYDSYIFLLFCMDTIPFEKSNIKKGIFELLKFYTTCIEISQDVLVNNHLKSLKAGVEKIIPYKFLEYIWSNYSTQLDIDMTRQTSSSKYLTKPMFLRLKTVLNTNDVDPPVSKIPTGFIKTLLNHIRIYYWYSKKPELKTQDLKTLITYDRNLLQTVLTVLEECNDQISADQKNLFFSTMEYYYFIKELDIQGSFYLKWVRRFENTRIFHTIYDNLDVILTKERLSKV